MGVNQVSATTTSTSTYSPSSETAGTIASASIFSTETAGTVASSSSGFCVFA